jgi:hypothetical protein
MVEVRLRVGVASGVLAVAALLAPAATTVTVAAGHPPIVRIHEGTSSNWSGYAATGPAGTFTNVSATWTQPKVTCGSQNTYSSSWVGLDGDTSSTVEQLGTEADCSGGTAKYYAWYEMYPRPGYLIPITVNPSDVLSASVVASLRGFTLTLNDITTGKSFQTTQKLNSAARSSAEVIVEAPWSGGVLPLANYGTVSFSGATANSHPLGSQSPENIVMVNPYGMKSTPTAFDSTNQAFSVNWSAS